MKIIIFCCFLLGCSSIPKEKPYVENPWICYGEANELAQMWKLTCDWQLNWDYSAEQAIEEAGRND